MTGIDANSVSIDDVAVPPGPPRVGPDTAALVEEAVADLIPMRFPLSAGDARATLHALSSLAAEVRTRLDDAIADARDQDSSWEEIAICLGTSLGSARRRYASLVRSRPGAPIED